MSQTVLVKELKMLFTGIKALERSASFCANLNGIYRSLVDRLEELSKISEPKVRLRGYWKIGRVGRMQNSEQMISDIELKSVEPLDNHGTLSRWRDTDGIIKAIATDKSVVEVTFEIPGAMVELP